MSQLSHHHEINGEYEYIPSLPGIVCAADVVVLKEVWTVEVYNIVQLD